MNETEIIHLKDILTHYQDAMEVIIHECRNPMKVIQTATKALALDKKYQGPYDEDKMVIHEN